MTIRKWGAERVVATTGGGIDSGPNGRTFDVAALTDGGYVVFWVDQSISPSVIRGQRYSATGGAVGAAFEVDQGLVLPKVELSATGLADGGFAVQYSLLDGGSLDQHIVRFNAAGSVTQGFILDANAVDEQDPALAPLADGGWVAAERDASSGADDIFFIRFNGTGATTTAWTDPTGAAAGVQRAPAIAEIDGAGKIAVVWFSDATTNYVLRVYDSSNTSLGPGIVVKHVDSSSDADYPPSVTAIGNRRFVVVWHEFENDSADLSGFAVKARIYDENGGAVSSEILVNARYAGVQGRMEVVATPDGGFVVAFVDDSYNDRDIAVRAFDNSGVPLGTQIRINTTVAGTDDDPHIAALADGRIAVTWSNFNTLRTQIIDPRDGLIEGDANANTLYGHDIVNDEISGLDGADTLFGLGGADALYGGAGGDTLDGGNGDDVLYGGADSDSLRGGLGDDSVYGEAGNDVLQGSLGADILDGGDGVDTLDYRTSAGVTMALDMTLVGTDQAAGDTYARIEKVLGSLTGADHIRGDAAGNSLYGYGGADTLEGGGGADFLYGGTGVDTLTGGAAADRYCFDALTEIGDLITDFASNEYIQVKASTFGGGLVAGTASAAQFQSSLTNVVAPGGVNVRFIFETDTTQLWFDPDGDGAAGPVLIADLQAGATLAAANIKII